jgi:hypothetical protein
MPRFLKYYVAIAVFAALLSVGLGIAVNFQGSNRQIYCDFESGEGYARSNTDVGACDPRIGKIVHVFGPIYLCVLVAVLLPAGIYATVRHNPNETLLVRIFGPGLISRLFPWRSSPHGDGISSPGPFAKFASRIDRCVGRCGIGFFVVTAVGAFLWASLGVWTGVDMNSQEYYCSRQVSPSALNFYVGGEPCSLEYFRVLGKIVLFSVMLIVVFNVPTFLYCGLKYCFSWVVWIRRSFVR